MIITKEVAKRGIEIAKEIKGKNLGGAGISEYNSEYNEYIKPKLDEYKDDYDKSPNTLFKDFIRDYLTRNDLSYDYSQHKYRGQRINQFAWACIESGKADKNFRNSPQLFILVSPWDIRFGFCYGTDINDNDICVDMVRDKEDVQQKILEKIEDNELNLYEYETGKAPDLSPSLSLTIENEEDLIEKWSSKATLIKYFKKDEIPEDIESEIEETFNQLLDIYEEIEGALHEELEEEEEIEEETERDETEEEEKVEDEIEDRIGDKLEERLSESSLDCIDNLYFHSKDEDIKENLVSKIRAALTSEKHIILTGPPGTGKTEVAVGICKCLLENTGNLYDDYQLTTATADWSTFDTVGGYMPSKKGDSRLEFKSGQILRRFKDPDDRSQKNELLIIDEINRADIDKAFGPIFTLLSGQEVQIPFRVKEEDEDEGKEIKLIPYRPDKEKVDESEYIVPKSWRIIATMNSYDKTSLYEMSYAFMRRFQFIRIDVPEIPDPDDSPDEAKKMMEGYLKCWEDVDFDPGDDDVSKLVKIWHQANAVEGRKIGPAIVKDMLGYLDKTRDTGIDEDGRDVAEEEFTEAVIGYIIPQLEGVPEANDIIEKIMKVKVINEDKLKKAAYEMLQVDFGEENG